MKNEYRIQLINEDEYVQLTTTIKSFSNDGQMSDCIAAELFSDHVMTESQSNASNEQMIVHLIAAELAHYDKFSKQKNDKQSPIDFWHEMQQLLSAIKLDILSIPASSASVERLFSAASPAKSDIRSRIGENSVENECTIRFN
jgi:hypothetical protein